MCAYQEHVGRTAGKEKEEILTKQRLNVIL